MPTFLITTADVRRRMKSVRQTGTRAELLIRSELFRRGLRYRVDVAPLVGIRRRADVVFRRERVAVFVDGCFWHGCPIHATWPKSNATFWKTKIEGNRVRDADTNSQLAAAGWHVLRIWEHEAAGAAADRVVAMLRRIRRRRDN